MATELIEGDAREFRDDLIELYQSDGNEAFGSLFDWYYSDSGSLRPRTWVLRDTASRNIVGTYSVVYREFIGRGIPLNIGVAGNLLVHPAHRSAFAAITLVRAARRTVDEGQCDVLLGLPMPEARKVLDALRFHPIGTLVGHACVLDASRPLSRKLGTIGTVVAPLVDIASAAARRLSRVPPDVSVTEMSTRDLDSVDVSGWKAPAALLAPKANMAYFRWRTNHPIVRHTAYGIRFRGELQGLVCVAEAGSEAGDANLCMTNDSVLTHRTAVTALTRALHGRYAVLSVTPMAGSVLARELLRSGFIRRRWARGDAAHVLGYWKEEHPLSSLFRDPAAWVFLPGLNDV